MAASVWLNGQFVEEADASISLRDAGLLHAAGVFTSLRTFGGRAFHLDDHLKRLRDSCEALFIPMQFKDDVLASAVNELLKRNNLADARLRLTVTRGTVHQDPLHGPHLQPNVFLTAAAIEPYPAEFYEKGLTVIALDEQKLNPYDLQAGHKTLNYFSRLAALREANRRGAGEALWFDVHNSLQSGSISNVFIAKNGKLLTPPTNAELRNPSTAESYLRNRSAVLPGVTRGEVIRLAESTGIEVLRTAIDIEQLLGGDEIFLTNSIMGVMPVCRIERKAIGDDKPGSLTRRLASLYDKQIQQGISGG